MPTDLFTPLSALHRPGQSLQKVTRKIVSMTSPAGVLRVVAQDDEARPSHPLSCLFENAAEVYDFLAWFDRRAGQLTAFWVPSYQVDMLPLETIADDAVEFDIASWGYADYLFPLQRRKSIAFVRADGTFVVRSIEDAVNNGDGTETITINEALGQDFTAGRASGICFMWYGRLEDDAAAVRWDTATTASCDLTMIELIDAPIAGGGGGGGGGGELPNCPHLVVISFSGAHQGEIIAIPTYSDPDDPIPEATEDWTSYTTWDGGTVGFWMYVEGLDNRGLDPPPIPLTESGGQIQFISQGLSFVPLGVIAVLHRKFGGFEPGQNVKFIENKTVDGTGITTVTTVRVVTDLVADDDGFVTVSLTWTNSDAGILMSAYDFNGGLYIDSDESDCIEESF